MGALYEEDFYGWTQEQAELLGRAGASGSDAAAGIDWENVAGEIRELGSAIEDELYDRYIILLSRLLRWKHQPGFRGGSWGGPVREQRLRIARLLRRNPGVRPRRGAELKEAYEVARERASSESGLAITAFPDACPFTLAQVEDRDFWPDPDA